MDDFTQRGLVYPDPIRRILFLFKLIRNNDGPASPLGVFYSQMSAAPAENRTFVYTKNQFLNFDLGKLAQRSKSKNGKLYLRNRIEDDLLSAIKTSKLVSARSIFFLVAIY